MEGDNKIAVIIGCSLGGAGLLFIVILLIVCCCSARRNRRKKEREEVKRQKPSSAGIDGKSVDYFHHKTGVLNPSHVLNYSYQKTGVINPSHLTQPQFVRTGSHQWRSTSSLTKPFPRTATNQVIDEDQEQEQGSDWTLGHQVPRDNDPLPPQLHNQYMDSHQPPALVPWYQRTLGRAKEFFIHRPTYTQSQRDSGEQFNNGMPTAQPGGYRARAREGSGMGEILDKPLPHINQTDYTSASNQRLSIPTNERFSARPYSTYDSNAALLVNDFNNTSSLESNGALHGVYGQVSQHVARHPQHYTETRDTGEVRAEPLYSSRVNQLRNTQSIESNSEQGHRVNNQYPNSVVDSSSPSHEMSIPRPLLLNHIKGTNVSSAMPPEVKIPRPEYTGYTTAGHAAADPRPSPGMMRQQSVTVENNTVGEAFKFLEELDD